MFMRMRRRRVSISSCNGEAERVLEWAPSEKKGARVRDASGQERIVKINNPLRLHSGLKARAALWAETSKFLGVCSREAASLGECQDRCRYPKSSAKVRSISWNLVWKDQFNLQI